MNPHNHLATSQARCVAYLIDLVAASLVLLPAGYAAYCLDAPGAGIAQFSVIFLAYHLYFLTQRQGITFGKSIMNIGVLSRTGQPLAPPQAVLRAVLLALPWLLMAAGQSEWASQALERSALASVPTAGASLIAADLVLIELARDRRSLSDRLASSVVVVLPPLQPHRAPAVPMFSARDAEFGDPPRQPPKR